jgi:Putative Actinobacterial Holin-X, holin superfamily III
MLREVLHLLGVDLDHKLAQIRAQLEEFKARTTHQLTEQVKATGLMVGFAFVGAVAAIATFVIVLVALYRWVDMYKGRFAALAAVGAVMILLATAMFVLAFGRKPRKPDVDRRPERLTTAFTPHASADLCRTACGFASATIECLRLRCPDASIFDARGRRWRRGHRCCGPHHAHRL